MTENEYHKLPETKVIDGMNEHDGHDHFKTSRYNEDKA